LTKLRLMYWYEYKKWIDSNIPSARETGRRCAEMVFKKEDTEIIEGSDILSELDLEIIEFFGL